MHAGTSAQALVWNNTRDDLSAAAVVVVGCHCINGQWRAMGIVINGQWRAMEGNGHREGRARNAQTP
jgi:hypothetical protein